MKRKQSSPEEYKHGVTERESARNHGLIGEVLGLVGYISKTVRGLLQPGSLNHAGVNENVLIAIIALDKSETFFATPADAGEISKLVDTYVSARWKRPSSLRELNVSKG